MLKPAQVFVSANKIVGDRMIETAGVRQGANRAARGWLAKPRVAATGNELLCLSEELDLTNATAAQLNVVARNGDVVVSAVRIDLPLDRM